MQNLLSIYVNGVLQEPGVSYTFDGGTTFNFAIPPEESDDIAVFFYKGTTGGSNPDTSTKEDPETLKTGDVIEIGTIETIMSNPKQDYTKKLVESHRYSSVS